jgi:hypothetical protein
MQLNQNFKLLIYIYKYINLNNFRVYCLFKNFRIKIFNQKTTKLVKSSLCNAMTLVLNQIKKNKFLVI